MVDSLINTLNYLMPTALQSGHVIEKDKEDGGEALRHGCDPAQAYLQTSSARRGAAGLLVVVTSYLTSYLQPAFLSQVCRLSSEEGDACFSPSFCFLDTGTDLTIISLSA